MFTLSEARERVLAYLVDVLAGRGGGPVIYDDRTTAKPYGWIFLFNTRRFVETGDPLESLVGMGPIVFLAVTGEVVPLGSRSRWEVMVEEFEKTRGLASRD